MVPRRVIAVIAVSLGASLLVPACSQTTTHRVLSFFFDGVPGPEGKAPTTRPKAKTDLPETRRRSSRAPRRRTVFSHPPYKKSRCTVCHDMYQGRLVMTPEEGLCATCHLPPRDKDRYVHGPVAVNACLYCHHPHESSRPHLLLDDATVICFRCHRRSDLTEGTHHAKIDDQSCIECHAPHGGSNRFFLKRSER